MKLWETAISHQSVSEVEREKNSCLLPDITDFHSFTFEGLEETVRELKEKQVPVYFTIDLDCMDVSISGNRDVRRQAA